MVAIGGSVNCAGVRQGEAHLSVENIAEESELLPHLLWVNRGLVRPAYLGTV